MAGRNYNANSLKIKAHFPRPDEPVRYEGNENPTPRQFAAQGFETIARAHPEYPYADKERDTTYDDADTNPYSFG